MVVTSASIAPGKERTLTAAMQEQSKRGIPQSLIIKQSKSLRDRFGGFQGSVSVILTKLSFGLIWTFLRHNFINYSTLMQDTANGKGTLYFASLSQNP